MISHIQGQDDAVKYLRKVLEGTFTSPLLLSGDDGVGRRFSIQCLVREMFCSGSKTLECDCHHCVQLGQDVHPDYIPLASVDDKDIGVDAVRDIVEQASNFPILSRVKVFFIDDAERFTIPAANALLKTLEEPPRTVRFFLSTTSYDRVIPTIRSRCAMVQYRKLPETFILEKLKQFETSPEKALAYARLAEGSVGSAIRYWGSKKLKLRDHMVKILKVCLSGDIPQVFSSVDEITADLALGLRFLGTLVHDLFVDLHGVEQIVNVDIRGEIREIRGAVKEEKLIRFWGDLKALMRLDRMSNGINLPFHAKALFAKAFV